MPETATQPSVSLFELCLLFEDHPTPELVIAMCEQACTKAGRPIENYHDLVRSMYQVPVGVDVGKWLQGELDYLHFCLLEVGVNRYLAINKT